MYLQGQSKLADQLKKSYSLNDLDTNDDDRRFTPNSQAIEEEDDETGEENEFKHEVGSSICDNIEVMIIMCVCVCVCVSNTM